jgi:hypothetical protein
MAKLRGAEAPRSGWAKEPRRQRAEAPKSGGEDFPLIKINSPWSETLPAGVGMRSSDQRAKALKPSALKKNSLKKNLLLI